MRLWLPLFIFLSQVHFAPGQNSYEPLHGVTGYDYTIRGELELSFTTCVNDKKGIKYEWTYQIKSPVLLSFNLNDLKFFKADPKEFIGYVENQYDAFSGYSGGGLIHIPQGGYREEENWMKVNEHLKWWENGELTEIKAQGELYPVLAVYFSIPDYSTKYNANFDQLQFRITIAGCSDQHFYPSRNIVVEQADSKLNQKLSNLIDKESMDQLELADPAAAAEMKKALVLLQDSALELSANISCGTFYGQDLVDALTINQLTDADSAKKSEFERRFETTYFKDLPHINALKLINYLIKPVGNYETPLVGSFSSNSQYGSEQATYQGTLRLWGNQVRKDE